MQVIKRLRTTALERLFNLV